MAYCVGDLLRVSATFTNSAGSEIDPTAVLFSFKDPSGNKTSYTYGLHEQLVKDDTGDYHVDISMDESGKWYYRFYSTGTGQAAEEGEFKIEASQF